MPKTSAKARPAGNPPGPTFDRERLHGTNVNPDSLLATDYLNHFNDVEMMLEIIPDVPDCFDDIAGWEPLGYCDHFARSGLRDAEIAVEAYHAADPELVGVFEAVIDKLNATTQRALATIRAAMEGENRDLLAFACVGAASEMRVLLSEANRIIAGAEIGTAESPGRTQRAVNALFDD